MFRLGGGRVLKLTTDHSEALAMNIVRKRPSPFVAKTYDVFQVAGARSARPQGRRKSTPTRELYGIVLEELRSSDRTLKSFADSLAEWLGFEYRGGLDGQAVDTFLRSTHDWNTDESGTHYSEPKYALQALFFEKAGQYLERAGIQTSDVYSGNVMMDGGDYKLIDLGYSKVPAGGRLETLAAMLDGLAEALEKRGAPDLAMVVDATANELLEQRGDMLEQTGFDDVMRRDDEVADKIYDDRIPSIDETTLLYQTP